VRRAWVACAPLALAMVVMLASAAPAAAQQSGVNVARYRFAITLPDTGQTIRVDEMVELQRAAGVNELRLDLLAPMRVRRVRQGCDATRQRTASFTHADDVVTVTLAAQGTDTITCVRIEYSGAPADGLVITTDSAGRWRAFGDNWPNRARHWLASIDHPSDKAIVEFTVDAPASRRIVANGTQRAQEAKGSRVVTTWGTVAPIPTYLMVIAAAPLAEHDLGNTACGLGSIGRCVPQKVFTAPEQARYSPGNFRFADDILRYFARTVGPYPYEQLAHLQSSTRFGGMENAGAIFYADQLFRTQDGVSIGLIAHETAHQWFGNTVTQREWGHLWLSEGFATYFAALYTEHASGAARFRTQMEGIRRTIIASAVVAERPVIDTAQADLMALLNTNSYQKGGFVLHMLRSEVGDSAFFRGVRSYWATNRHGNAMTADLRAAVEREAGRDLGWFFEQWLTRPGFAQVTTSWAHDTTNGGIALSVEQGPRFPPYRFQLRLEVEASDGSKSLVRVEVPAEAHARLLLPGAWKVIPRAVRADPHAELLAEFFTSSAAP
jgi:aminopeptidase N